MKKGSLSSAPPSPEGLRFRAPPAVVRADVSAPEFDDDVDTGVVALSPELLEAIRSIAPKRRRSKSPYVIALALVAAAAAVGLDRPLREFVTTRANLLPAAAGAQKAMRTRL